MERIHEAWSRNQVLSVVSFDVKGAYNGVAKEVLIRRLQQRRVPTALVQWIDAFCSHRRAMIVINDYCSEAMEITYPGLPQGSPLSPILYLFFNADLVDVPINKHEGAIAFVDDYNRWVVGQSADANTETLQAHIIPKALSWAARSGATFEAQKTQYIHFTRSANRNPQPVQPLKVDEQRIAPSNTVKLLGVICDQKLKFREHIGRATKRGIRASQALMRLRGLRPQSARQLYQALVVSTITYAASVWATVNKHGNIPEWIVKPMGVIQKTTAKLVAGLFRTVSRPVAEGEASIIPLNIYLQKRILRHWINCNSLPKDHPIQKCLRTRGLLASQSPFGKLNQVLPLCHTRVEPILPYIACPWESNWKKAIVLDQVQIGNPVWSDKPKIHMYTYGSARNGRAAFGIAVMMGNAITQSTSRTVETHENTDLHNVQLGAILEALRQVTELQETFPAVKGCMGIRVYATNPSVLQSIINPWVQGGQQVIRKIVQLVRELQKDQVDLQIGWVGSEEDTLGIPMAKAAAQYATRKSSAPNPPDWATQRVLSAIWRKIRENLGQAHSQQFWQDPFGKHTKAIDAALPGKHTKDMYDQLHRAQASTLAQLRTGHIRLNRYLHRIGQALDDICDCQEGPETVTISYLIANYGKHTAAR
jgi:hypothetical protein